MCQTMFFLNRFLVIGLQIRSSLCKLFKQQEHGTLLMAQRKAYDQKTSKEIAGFAVETATVVTATPQVERQ